MDCSVCNDLMAKQCCESVPTLTGGKVNDGIGWKWLCPRTQSFVL